MGKLDNGASGDEILERMTHYLICPSFLPHVSWTGRGKGKERKFALSSCVRLVNFIVITINKIDSSYNHKKVVSDMTYGILKRAPLKFGKIKACNQKDCPVPISKELDSEKKKQIQPMRTSWLVLAQKRFHCHRNHRLRRVVVRNINLKRQTKTT